MSILKDNSYHILGLDSSASQKDVSRRSREILTRLKIDDVPSFDLDMFEGFRTVESVKSAVDRLVSPKNQIKEYFFWFQVADVVDEEAVGFIKNGEYDLAALVWEKHCSGNTGKSLLYKKNLAILYSLLLYKGKKASYLDKSIGAWKELVDSEKFWGTFSKVYKLHDEFGIDSGVIDGFRKLVVDFISDIFADLSSQTQDPVFVSSFSNTFGLHGQKMTTDVVGPIYKKINDAIESLDKLHVSADGVIDPQEAAAIKIGIHVIQEELNKLLDLGLYDDSRTKQLRDRAASVLRKISIDIHNNLNETGTALGLIKIADKISGTEAVKARIQQDLKTTQENIDAKDRDERYGKIVDPIITDVGSGHADRALQTINGYLYNPNTPADLKKVMQEIKAVIEERTVKYGKPVGKAPGLYTLNGIGTKLYGDTVYFVVIFIPLFALGRYTVESADGNMYSFKGKLELKSWQKIYNWVVAIVLLIWIISASNS